MLRTSLVVFLTVSGLVSPALATDITVYKDANCETSQQNISGPNGLPDGACTAFEEKVDSNYSSFQVVDLDEGCGVTIYGSNSNSLTCSSKSIQMAELAACYNTSWVYYSIDNCVSPPSSTTSASSSSDSPSSSTPTGAIAGGIIGGLAALGISIGAVLYFRRGKGSGPRATSGDSVVNDPGLTQQRAATELQGDEAKFEMDAIGRPTELTDARSPVEMEGDTRFATTVRET